MEMGYGNLPLEAGGEPVPRRLKCTHEGFATNDFLPGPGGGACGVCDHLLRLGPRGKVSWGGARVVVIIANSVPWVAVSCRGLPWVAVGCRESECY